jgi:hypothetical protein
MSSPRMGWCHDPEGVISKRVVSAVQEAFNQLSRETGRDLSQLSRVLAASV